MDWEGGGFGNVGNCGGGCLQIVFCSRRTCRFAGKALSQDGGGIKRCDKKVVLRILDM